VVLMAFSEFGRRMKENTSRDTEGPTLRRRLIAAANPNE
jgi:hypothetical protein